jgi:hypothetical protein
MILERLCKKVEHHKEDPEDIILELRSHINGLDLKFKKMKEKTK